jgi:hypothetical protein
MAVGYNPKIVTDGLLMALDAANIKSYPGSGITWFDVSGNNLNGTLINAPSFSGDGLGSFSFVTANNQRCTVTTSNVMSRTAYTKMAFFRCNNFGPSNNIISFSPQHNFWLGGTNRLRAGHAASSINAVVGATDLTTNQWYCGACTFSATTGWALYLDGALDGTSTNTTQFSGDGGIDVGAYGAGNFFSGNLAFPMVYNRVLTVNEIQQNFNAVRGRYGI